MNRLQTLAKKYHLTYVQDDHKIQIKPIFSLRSQADIGLLLMIIIPIVLICYVFNKIDDFGIHIIFIISFISLIPIGALLAIFKTYNDNVLIDKEHIIFTNSLKKRIIPLHPDLKFKLKKDTIKIKLRYSTGRYTIIDLYVVKNKKKYRFLDFSSDKKNSSELKELGNLILDEIKKHINALPSSRL